MSNSNNRVLLVEDESAHAELVRRTFSRHASEFELRVAQTIDEARGAIEESPPRLLIADYLLPDGNGIELIPKDPEGAGFPVVLLTSHGNENVAVEALKAGALDYVIKSEVTLADMPHIVQRALREWDGRQMIRQAELDRKRFEAIVHATTDLVAMADPTGRILYVNPAGRRLLGIPEEGKLGALTIAALYPLGTSETIATTAIASAVRSGNWSGQSTLITRADVEVPVSLVLLAHKDEAGKVMFLSTIARDLTQQKQAEDEARERAIADAKLSVLSPRENEVLDLVVAGRPNKVIAAQLSLSEKTIEKHRANLMRKLKVRTVAELVRLAVAAQR